MPCLGSWTSIISRASLGWMRNVDSMSVWSKGQGWKHLDPWVHLTLQPPYPSQLPSRSHPRCPPHHRCITRWFGWCAHTYTWWNLVQLTWEPTCNRPRTKDQGRPRWEAVNHKCARTYDLVNQASPTLGTTSQPTVERWSGPCMSKGSWS
jgi:hypothetical protein